MRNSVVIFLVLMGILFSFPQWLDAQWVQTGGPASGFIKAFVVSGTNLFVCNYRGIFLSTDNGKSWAEVNFGLPSVSCFAVSGTNLFAGTNKGVFLSTDNGQNWNTINSGLPEKTWVRWLAASGTNLFASASGGVWRLSLSDLSNKKR
jgi:photosystem II stability/assembly factor-like uncharacterized protein